MIHADKPHTSVAGDMYKARVGDIVSVEARITEIKGNRFVVEPLNGAEVYLSDVSRYTELQAPLDSRVIKRPLRVGDKVRYNAEPGVKQSYWRGRLVAYDNGHWIIRDNSSQRTGGSLVERTEADIHYDL